MEQLKSNLKTIAAILDRIEVKGGQNVMTMAGAIQCLGETIQLVDRMDQEQKSKEES